MEFIFAQFSPAVCLPCKQTDLVQRIIALFKVLLYRVSSKKLLKIENTRSNQLELEFSFSFDPFNFKNFFITSSFPFLFPTHFVAVLFPGWLSSSDDYGVVSVPTSVERSYPFSLRCCSLVRQSYYSWLLLSSLHCEGMW